MPVKSKQHVGRKNELEQFRHILSQRGLKTQSRVILIQGPDGFGKTSLAERCLEIARKARWNTVTVNWAQNTPNTPSELLTTLADAIWNVIGDQQVHFLNEVGSRIEAVQQTVDRYQQNNPEIWQQMLVAGDNEPNQQTAVLSDFHDADHDARQRLINYMQQQRIFPRKMDDLVVLEPMRKLAQAISESIAKGVSRRGLVILFDGCEALPPEIDVFFKEAVICPTVHKNAKLHFILASRRDQYHKQSIPDVLKQIHRIKGYGDYLYTPQPLVWEMRRMVDPEVEDYLKNRQLEDDSILVDVMQKISQGIPIVVELVTDVIHEQGYDQTLDIYPPTAMADLQTTKIIEDIIRRLIENYQDPTEIQLLFALALLLSPNDAALSSICSLSADDTPAPIRQKLSKTYTFVEPDGRLHNVLRSYLRRYLRSTSREYAQFLGHNAAIHFQTVINNYAGQQVEERINDHRWQSTQTNLMNALCWTDEKRVLKLLASTILEAGLYNPSYGQSLLKLTSEFRHTASYWSAESCHLWDTLAKSLHADIKVRLAALESLADKDDIINLSKTHHAIRSILIAQLYVVYNLAAKAIQLCDTISDDALVDGSIKRILAMTYANAGVALGFDAGIVVASEDARHAFKRAVTLEPQSAAFHYGLGAVLAAFNQLEDAVASFSTVLHFDPKHPNTTYRRGLAYFKLGEFSSALVDFNQTLNVNQQHAIAAYFRGLTYRNLGDQNKAIADFSRAITINPNMVQAYTKRGVSYTSIEQFDKALADFAQVLQRDPGITEVYTNRGEIYMKLDQPENAMQDFTQALRLEPDSAAMHELRGFAYARLQQHQYAIEDYDQALALNPSLASVYAKRGDSYTALSVHENALEDYTQALENNPQDAQTFTKRGAIYTQLGQHYDALADFEHALELDSRQVDAFINRANVYIALEQFDNALDDYNTALSLDPKLTGFEAERGLAYLKLKQYENALTDLTIASARDPNDAIILFHQGVSHYHLGRYDAALLDFREALSLNPQLVEVYIHRAKTQVQLGNLEQALIDFGQAISVNSQNADAFYNRGAIQVDFQRFSEAIADFNQAIQLDPSLADAYNKRGFCYANLNQVDNALQDFAQAINLNPRDASVYNNRGNTYAKLNENEKALLDYTQAITRNPQMAEAYYNRANILTEMGQLDNAIADFSQAISLNPEIDQAYYNRGNTYAQLGQLQKALADLDRVIAKNPQDTTALNNRGNIYADMGKPELALADYEQALSLNPELGEVYTNRGLTFADTGRYDEALTDYACALSINSNDATAIYYSACTFGLLKDESQACAWLEQAILLDESFRAMAENDPDFDGVRSAPCFRELMGNA